MGAAVLRGPKGRVDRSGKVHRYCGRERFQEYLAAVQAAAPTVSPGGVADRLRITRQYAHDLIDAGRFEAYVFCDREGARSSYIEVCVRDVEAFAASWKRQR